MKPLYTSEEFENSSINDKLPCQCYNCNKTFMKTKKRIIVFLENKGTDVIKYCSRKCCEESRKDRVTVSCANCSKEIDKTPSQIKKSKSGNHFCSKSCSVSFNNKNKTFGTRRSKLEAYIEEQLTELYPDLDLVFNGKEAIGSELDIHIPSLNLAFELNGIFHYEPIYGTDKLQQIQENDASKTKACHDAKIDLCIIDTSGQKYFKPKTSQKYLDIIVDVINKR